MVGPSSASERTASPMRRFRGLLFPDTKGHFGEELQKPAAHLYPVAYALSVRRIGTHHRFVLIAFPKHKRTRRSTLR